MPDLICLGEAMVEFNQQPHSAHDSEGNDLYKAGFGGDTSNTAIAAARQGAKSGYVTALGTDRFGDLLMQLWAREEVDAAGVKRDEKAPTGIYFVTHSAAGHQFHYYRAGSAASRMTPADLPLDYLRGGKVLHVSAISQAISETACATVFAAMDAARAAGLEVCFDTNLRLKLWPLERARVAIDQAIRKANILRPALDDARTLTGIEDPDAILDHFLALGPKLVVMTMGKDGVILASREARHRLPPNRVDAVDATGAGDTFNGSFLARLIAGDAPLEAARYANAAAALSTTGYGAVAPIPRPAEVYRFLRA
ncbi:sugar kinase [Dongia sp.]|uniref:sugar kinase n=1 Tax=Dongia sp. TaxID=1977262 RepID=UPI003753E62C